MAVFHCFVTARKDIQPVKSPVPKITLVLWHYCVKLECLTKVDSSIGNTVIVTTDVSGDYVLCFLF